MLSFLKIAAAAYIAYAALLYFLQRPLTYHGTRLPSPAQDAIPDDADLLELPASGGVVPAWWFPGSDPGPGPALIVAHGNAELIADNVAAARRLKDLGMGVLLVEYPGYGSAGGSPSRRTIQEIFTLAWDRLAARPEVDQSRIAGLGRSLGGGAITDLAVARPLQALVLQSVFYSLGSMVARGYLMPPFLVRDRFDNAANLQTWQGPALILHGERDRIVSIGHAERLAALRDGIRLLRFDCGHNDCPWGSDEVLDELRVFLMESGVLEAFPE